MIVATVTDTKMQNDFTTDLNIIMERREVRRFVSKEATILYLTGILKGDYDLNQVQEEELKENFEIINL